MTVAEVVWNGRWNGRWSGMKTVMNMMEKELENSNN